MPSELPVIESRERVLSTLNQDGSRRWLRPWLSPGGFHRWRQRLAFALMLVFFVIPYLQMNGKPLVLLDLPRREFTFFGTTFLATETLILMLGLAALFAAILVVTALFGRVWCGWACPQTVYMEFLFRPIEYWLEGGPRGTLAIDRVKAMHPKRVLKYAIYWVLAMFLAHTFLAYFVGIETLARWVQTPPQEHPTAFAVMLVTTVMIFIDFTYFREQTCLVACPYGRLQSVLLDRQSLIVGYDRRRGEPRERGVKTRPETAGDCIDCQMCVTTCPTGIDIRDGLQMECIHCTQCADACDTVMTKIGKPVGLIRYTSREEVEGAPRRILRPRVIVYPALLVGLLALLAATIGTRADAEVTLLRGIGAPYQTDAEGRLVNQVRIRVRNRAAQERRYRIELADDSGLHLIAPINPLEVAAGEIRTTSVFVVIDAQSLAGGERTVVFRVGDGERFTFESDYRLVGPATERRAPLDTEGGSIR